jgi:hypothetical protein
MAKENPWLPTRDPLLRLKNGFAQDDAGFEKFQSSHYTTISPSC